MKFHVGQMVRIVSRRSSLFGQTVTIISPLQLVDRIAANSPGVIETILAHDVDVAADVPYAFMPSEMEPIYDGNQKSTWEKCAWKPSEIHA